MEKTQPLERCLEVFFQFFGCFGGGDFLDQIFKASSTHKKKTDVFLAFSHGKDMLQFVVFAVTLFYLNLCMRIPDTLFLSFLPEDEA